MDNQNKLNFFLSASLKGFGPRKMPLFIATIAFMMSSISWGDSVADTLHRSVEVSAVVSRNPPTITLSWPVQNQSTSYLIYRKSCQAKSWGLPVATLAALSTSYTDTNVVIGSAYEYMILGSAITTPTIPTSIYTTYGFIRAGIDIPMIDSRGKLILIVDDTYAAALDAELARLQQDLVGDGWTVLRHDVTQTQTVTSIKALIKADYNADPANVKSVFLFGHVPIPWSGDTAPVNHVESIGAAEADVFYANMNGVWTDTLVNNLNAYSYPTHSNLPGDGKYDQSVLPSDTELQIGRVDLSNMSTFLPKTEQALLQQYLNKDHNFRTGALHVPQRGINIGLISYTGGDSTAAGGWRNLPALVGLPNVFCATNATALSFSSNAWFDPAPAVPPFIWACHAGTGTEQTQNYIGTTANFVSMPDPGIVFATIFGSFVGNWSYQNDIMRAHLCTTTYGLGCMFGSPLFYLQPLALGDTVGAAAWMTQNNNGLLYPDNDRVDGRSRAIVDRKVYISWLGDPTLRLSPVIPPSGLIATTNVSTVNLNWTASTDTSIQGYLVYRALGFGSFTCLTPTVISGTSFMDSGVNNGIYSYMVRTVKLETNGSGNYYNPSQGIFQTVKVGNNGPGVAVVSPVNAATYYASQSVVMRASVDASYTGSVDFYNGSTKLGTATTAPYQYQWNSVPVGTYTLTARATNDNGTTISEPVTISVLSAPVELTAPWLQADVGATGLQGTAAIASGVFTVNGAGAGIAGTQDAFHAVYQPLNQNGSMIMKITSVQSPASAGLFIRDSMSPGSQGAAVLISSSGTVTFSQRLTAGATTSTTMDATTVTFPYWLKLTRSGDTISAYRSSDGAAWTQVGTNVTVSMGATPDTGMAVFSGSTSVSCAAAGSNASVLSAYINPIPVFRTPDAGATYALGASIPVLINEPYGFETDSLFQQIAFYEGSTLLATPSTARNLTWTPTSTGEHTVTAQITDQLGMVGTASLKVFVNPAGSTLPTTVITNVINGQAIVAPTNLTLTASATPANGKTIKQIDFYADGQLINTATSTPYSVTWNNVQPGNYSIVTARATDNTGVIGQSVPVFLFLFNPPPVAPSITNPPTNQTVNWNQPATFSVTANGDAPLSYQWSKNGTPISGAINASYSTPPTGSSDNGAQFSVVVSNAVSSVTSTNVNLTVILPSVPPIPGGLAAAPGSQIGSIDLSWLPSAGATSYQLERTLTSGSGYVYLAPISSTTSYTDTNLTAGLTYYYRVSAINGPSQSGYSTQGDGITLEASAVASIMTPRDLWRTTYFGTTDATGGRAWTANPSGDGISNLLKYALGLDPTKSYNPSGSRMPAMGTQITNGNNYLTHTFTGTAADVTYIVEATSDLSGAWETPIYTHTGSAPGTVTVKDSQPMSSSSHRFMRLRVTQP